MDGAIKNYVELHIKSAARVSAAKPHYAIHTWKRCYNEVWMAEQKNKTASLILSVSERVKNKLWLFWWFFFLQMDLRGKNYNLFKLQIYNFYYFCPLLACNVFQITMHVNLPRLIKRSENSAFVHRTWSVVQARSDANRKMNQALWSPAEAPGVTGNSLPSLLLTHTSCSMWNISSCLRDAPHPLSTAGGHLAMLQKHHEPRLSV